MNVTANWICGLIATAMFFGMVTVLSLAYQQHSHAERMACIAEHGVYTDSGCAWSKGEAR